LLEDFYFVFVNSNLYANLFLKISHAEMLSWMAYYNKVYSKTIGLCFTSMLPSW